MKRFTFLVYVLVVITSCQRGAAPDEPSATPQAPPVETEPEPVEPVEPETVSEVSPLDPKALELTDSAIEQGARLARASAINVEFAKLEANAGDCDRRCEWDGLCVPEKGRCLASDIGCAGSQGCAMHGNCAPAGPERCGPATTEHCASSALCRTDGRCQYFETSTFRGCAAPCDVEFLRSVEDLSTGVGICFRGEDRRPCPQTEVCKEFGFCESGGDLCHVVDPQCRRSEACRARGECYLGWDEGEPCVALTTEDCAASTGCTEHGRCQLLAGKCVTDAEAAKHCPAGKVLVNGSCQLPLGYACKEECDAENKCRPLELDRQYVICIETEEYCRNQPDCRARGLCAANDSGIVEFYRCAGASTSIHSCSSTIYGGCVKTEEDCRKSVDCRKRGNCSAATPSRYCRPTRTEHCEQSDICAEEGQCRLLDESSYFTCGD